MQMILLQEAWCIHDFKEQFTELWTLQRILMSEKPTALLASLPDQMDMFENCGVCGGESGFVLVNVLSDGAKKVTIRTFIVKWASTRMLDLELDP